MILTRTELVSLDKLSSREHFRTYFAYVVYDKGNDTTFVMSPKWAVIIMNADVYNPDKADYHSLGYDKIDAALKDASLKEFDVETLISTDERYSLAPTSVALFKKMITNFLVRYPNSVLKKSKFSKEILPVAKKFLKVSTKTATVIDMYNDVEYVVIHGTNDRSYRISVVHAGVTCF